MSKTENNILLFSITLCWAAAYIFIKELPTDLSTYGYLTLTCGIAALLLTIIFFKKMKRLNIQIIKKAAFLSTLLTLNLLFDKLGIDRLSSSTSSVLASCSILIVPIILILMRKFPSRNNLVGAIIIMIGILTTSGFRLDDLLGSGALFMLLSAVVASVYTIVVDKVTKEEDPILLSVMQMWISAILSFALWFIEEPSTFFSIHYTNQLLSSIFILAFFTKAYSYVALMYSQKYSDPISVTIIASTEPIVTLTLAVILPTAFDERFSITSVVGAAIIMVGAIVSGTNFISKRKAESLDGVQ